MICRILAAATAIGGTALLAGCGAAASGASPSSFSSAPVLAAPTSVATPTVEPVVTGVPTVTPSTPSPTAIAPVATIPPVTTVSSCDVAPTDGEDARVQVSGPDAGAVCTQMVSTLGSSSWTVIAGDSPVPEDDTKTMCQGTQGQSQFKVLDHEFIHVLGDEACSSLNGT